MPYILNVGCYVGWIPLLLAGAAALMKKNKYWPLAATTFIIGWIMLGESAPWNLWKPLHMLPGLSLLRMPSRFNVFVLFSIALLAGEGVEILKKRVIHLRWLRPLPFLIVVIVAADLLWVNGKVFRVAFSIPPLTTEEKGQLKHYMESPYLDHYRKRVLYDIFQNVRSAAFPAVLENRGVLDTYSTIDRETNVLSFNHPRYQGEAWLEGKEGKIISLTITPNRITVEIEGRGKTLVLNQNYDAGWKVKGIPVVKVHSYNGLLAVDIPTGKKIIDLVYLPPSFLWGATVTLITLLIIIIFVLPTSLPRNKYPPEL